ncbi:CDP-alcohol phosphatidyltransferase family protein [Actinoplanes sp. TBRC 11911]|nr:CDP-alcohol phosphatidyltransferase family protein [Actinoplanes sp. TBRC 11911]
MPFREPSGAPSGERSAGPLGEPATGPGLLRERAADSGVLRERSGAAQVREMAGAAQVREMAGRAQAAGERLLVCADNLVAHPSLLWLLATEPTGRSTVLVVADPDGDLREDRGRVLAAGGGPGTVRYVGAMCLAPADLPLLAEVADAPDLLKALLDAGLVPIATPVRLLHAEQVHTTDELLRARQAVAAVDEDKARLRLAVKEKDDFFTTYAVSTWSPIVTKAAARLKLTPTGVTALSVVFAVAAALAFWQASRPAMVAGGILLYLGFVLDCVDGQLARYTRRFDPFGGWLDTMADRAKEYAVYAGLAAGAERIGLPYAWPLAITAILLQTVRHMTDTWYGALHDEAAARPRAAAAAGVGARLSAASTKVQGDTGSAAYWLKRIVVFPIGERWALIAILAMVTNGRVALIAVVGWGLLAFAYTLALRSLRALSMRVGVLDTVDTARHRDDGPLVRAVLGRAGLPAPLAFAGLAALVAAALVAALLAGWVDGGIPVVITALIVLADGLPARARHDGPLDWLVPAALRAAEYLLVVGVGLAYDVPPAVVYLLLFTLALRHYDLTARMEKGAPGGRAGGPLGWDGRVLLLTVAAVVGQATLGEALLAGLTCGMFLANAVTDWRRGEVPA